MDELLYPMQFQPILKNKIWGSELWILSDVDNDKTKVFNGRLANNTLSELTEVFMDDFVGENVFKPNQNQFPILVKIISAIDKLSVQVHPNDTMAQKLGYKFGKSEMWYILDAKPDSFIIAGFNKKITPQEYKERLENKTLTEVLGVVPVKKHDIIYIPAGLVHAIGPNILLAEIQQTSDTTFRIYDWNRVDDKGQSRELHVEQAMEAIDFDMHNINVIHTPEKEIPLEMPMFETHWSITKFMRVKEEMKLNYYSHDSFAIIVIISGKGELEYKDMIIKYTTGTAILIPANVKEFLMKPQMVTEFIEVYSPKN